MAKKKDEIVIEQTDETPEPDTQEATHETTPEATPEELVNISSSELEQLRKEALSAKELGRTVKSLTSAHTTLKGQYDNQVKRVSDIERTLTESRQRQREQELEAAKGSGDLLDAVKLKHKAEDEWEKLHSERSVFEAERSQYQAELDEAARLKADNKAKELAKTSGLTADALLLIGTDTADNGRVSYNLKRMEDIAKNVPKGESVEEDEESDETSKVRGQRAIVSGAGSRSATRGLTTMEDYDRAYNEGRINSEEYEKARIRFGVAY